MIILQVLAVSFTLAISFILAVSCMFDDQMEKLQLLIFSPSFIMIPCSF